MVSNCPPPLVGVKLSYYAWWCQIVLGVKLSSLPSWCQIVLLAIMVSNCPKCQIVLGVKLSEVSNCPRCQIVLGSIYSKCLWQRPWKSTFKPSCISKKFTWYCPLNNVKIIFQNCCKMNMKNWSFKHIFLMRPYNLLDFRAGRLTIEMKSLAFVSQRKEY